MASTEASLATKYQKMTDLEHILKKPDTYIGSIQLTECTEYTTMTQGEGEGGATNIGLATFTHIPALYKLVDEGLVNMRDHVIRQAQAIKDGKPNALPVTSIEVEVDAATGTITMTNDGNGIDIAQHPEHKMWIPEMIFGHLRTSTNYAEDKKEKIVGGKNGFGFKLVLVWSTWGSVETVDHVRGLKYTQEFKNNLTEICAPKITTGGKKPYTRISFRPDYARFGIAGLTPDMIALFKKRVCDIAAVTDRSIRVKYNGAVVPVKDFKQYICLYDRPEGKCVFETASERWEYAVCLTPTDEFAHVSFVNGICTSKGGKHVEYVMGQLLRKLAAFIKTKKKVDVKPATIKEQLMLFLRCDIENPAFSSQTKDELTTTSANFGSACVVSDEFVEKVAKMGVMDAACALTEVKEAKAAKKTDGVKTRTIRGIPKLIDANFAGTEKSAQCTIIFCEGDSAKAGIVSGLSKEDRNTIGVYPVKGKFMNVRGEAVKRIAENTEIAEIKRILGLENGRKYTAEDVAKRLRYGKVLFMTDQDLDGSHIKGLGINLFQSEWPSLTHIPGFIGFMNTPILKARKGAQERVFYNEGEFEAWKSGSTSASGTSASGGVSPVDVSTWAIKYYKGLGTSTGREFREYFEHKKIVDFAYTGEPSDDAIDLVFNKKRADDRKQWLSTYNRADHLDTSHKHVTYEDFMTREMKHFSIYDNQRSIANGMDGLKISLRKILFAAFKKGGLKTEIKVAQFSGYVSEHSGYHHGEASLNGAIIGMAQNFVGSNNINLFEPNGQFGCIDPETPVLLWNGNIEKAKNIKVGDKLIGDDGGCRTVSKLTDGVDEMYEVSNGNMDNYIVNSHHILTVSFSGHKTIFWKKSSNSWFMNYFDDATKTAKHTSCRTTDSAKGTHFNKSCLTKQEAYEKMVEFSKTISDVNVFDINVQQYLALPKSAKQHVKGVINTTVVQWKEQELPIDPYILGLWLGDGMSKCNAFASMDAEIIKSWAVWTDTVGCEICHVKNIPPHENHSFYIRRRGSSTGKATAIGDPEHSRANCIGCTTSKHVCAACDWTFEKRTDSIKGDGKNSNGHNVVNLNPVVELFKKHNLYNNKHVPIEYILNSEENRLKILAGMIDTDGCLRKQNDSYRYAIAQCEKRKHLLESFRIIAGSLGFRAKILESTNGMFELLITGDNIHKIPVKLPRKQIPYQIRMKKYGTHNIEIKSIGRGAFCGWNIDQNERFLLGDFTITHNTRLSGGKDSASERYIFTQLNPITRLIYRAEDDAVLEYLDDDGQLVEPTFYAPIVPMVLVNGTKGIGTGFSTDIMCHNPLQIIDHIGNMLLQKPEAEWGPIEPYYRGFKGTITALTSGSGSGSGGKFLVKGLHAVDAAKKQVRVTELPVGYWTEDFKKHLEALIESGAIKDYVDMSTDTVVDFTITFPATADFGALTAVVDHGNAVEKLLKLYTTESTSNMHLFDSQDQLKKYGNVRDIVRDYYATRLSLYKKRKTHQLATMAAELLVLSNKARYIQELLDGSIDLRRKRGDELTAMLQSKGYDTMEGDEQYKYLLKLPMDSVSEENVQKLLKEKGQKELCHATLQGTSIEQLWLADLAELRAEYVKQEEKRGREVATLTVTPAKSGTKAQGKMKKA
jgi:DNA gyrase/topoisomerase IV subunit B